MLPVLIHVRSAAPDASQYDDDVVVKIVSGPDIAYPPAGPRPARQPTSPLV